MSGDKLRSPHVSWVFAQLVTFSISGPGATAFEPLAGGPLSRLAATALPKGEPSLASPFGGRWCPVGTVQRLTEPAGESAPAGGGEGSVRPPSWCAAVREKRFAVSLAFFPALRAYKVKGKVETFLKKSFIKKLYSCYRLACSYSAITVTNRAFTSPPQRWPWGMVGLK